MTDKLFNYTKFEKIQDKFLEKKTIEKLRKIEDMLEYRSYYKCFDEKKCKRIIKEDIGLCKLHFDMYNKSTTSLYKCGTYEEEVIDCWNKNIVMIELFKIHKMKHQKIKKLNRLAKYDCM